MVAVLLLSFLLHHHTIVLTEPAYKNIKQLKKRLLHCMEQERERNFKDIISIILLQQVFCCCNICGSGFFQVLLNGYFALSNKGFYEKG